jgi:transcriptional regulator with XRE-family HTH domain
VFGRALAVLRLSRGMSRNKLARAASIGASNLSNYERGLTQPREETLDRILEALKLPPAALARAQDFAQHPMRRDGTLPPDERDSGPATSRRAALKLAQEVGKAFAHITSRFWS